MTAADWAGLDDNALLEMKISSLGLALAGSELEPLIQQFQTELAGKGLAFQPHCFIGDE
jgi:hypothetical protein